MEAMPEEASDGWEEIFGIEARPAEKSQDGTPDRRTMRRRRA